MAADKLGTVDEAVDLISDGAVVGLGGAAGMRRPMALVRGLLKARRERLTLVTFAGGIDVEWLVVAGCVEAVRAAYVSLDVLGLAPHYQMDAGFRIIEETEGSIIQGLRASVSGLGFLPFHGTVGTDILPQRPDVKLVTCPYTGAEYPAWPAITPDVTVLHAWQADPAGNAVVTGSRGIDDLLVQAAGRVVVSAESIVPTAQLDVAAGSPLLASEVDMVVEAPYGAHPSACPPGYRADLPYLIDYVDACRAGQERDWIAEVARNEEAYHQAVAARDADLRLAGRDAS